MVGNKASRPPKWPVRFILDSPATQDSFGHQRVASALASIIRSQEDVKVIGLLGGWGSGKSTVVSLMEAELGGLHDGIYTYCFKYDAWLHQKDPPRRAFLETLVYFLKAQDISGDAASWQRRLDVLNRQIEESETKTTPMLTSTGRWMLASLFSVPLGLKFVGHEWVADEVAYSQWVYTLGWLLVLAPIILALGVYVHWRPKLPMNTKKFWSSHAPPHEHESIIGIFANRQIEIKKEIKSRSSEPTTIEFQDIFRDIMNSVSHPNRRFLFVIDNLDRLPESDGISMWGTIRSLFLGAEETGSIRRGHNLPVVVLPVDESSVKRLYKDVSGDEADDLARSFMDKTFDVTLLVPKPVISKWNDYLSIQLKYAFGDRMESDWPTVAGNIFESFTARRGIGITPRSINTYVNSIGALWPQWNSEGVSFASVAYYAAGHRLIDSNVYEEVQRPVGDIADLDPDWQRAVAAMHFGVEPKEALQVLLAEPIRTSIRTGDKAQFASLAAVPGFQRVLDQVIAGGLGGMGFPVSNATTLLASIDPDGAAELRQIWPKLRRLVGTGDWNLLAAVDADTFRLLAARCAPGQLRQFLSQVATKLAGVADQLNGPASGKEFLARATAIVEAAAAANIPPPQISVPTGTRGFISVLANMPPPSVLACLQPVGPMTEVVALLSNDLQNPQFAADAQHCLQLLAENHPSVDLGPAISVAAQVVEDGSPVLLPPSINVLGFLSRVPGAATIRIRQLRDTGQLYNRFADLARANAAEPVAQMTALLVLNEGAIDPPDGRSWEQMLEAMPEIPEIADKAFNDFDVESASLAGLTERLGRYGTLGPLSRRILSQRIREDRFGDLEGPKVVELRTQFMELVEPEVRSKFWVAASSTPDFWVSLGSLPLQDAAPIFHALLSAGTPKAESAKALVTMLNREAASTWANAIASGSEPVDLTLVLLKIGVRKPTVGGGLFDGLLAALPTVLATSDHQLRVRWFGLAPAVSASARSTLYKGLRDGLLYNTPADNLVPLLRLGGAELLRIGEFDKRSDESIRHIVLRLLGNAEGLEWLEQNEEPLGKWASRCDATTRSVLQEQLQAVGQMGLTLAEKIMPQS